MNSEKFVRHEGSERQASSERIERHELEEIEEKIEIILETLDRLEKLITSLLPPPPGKAVSAVLDFIS